MGWILWICARGVSGVVLRTLATRGRKRAGPTSEAQWEGWSEAEGPKDNTACDKPIPSYPITPNRRGCSQVLSTSGHPIDPKAKLATSGLIDFRSPDQPQSEAGALRSCRLPVTRSTPTRSGRLQVLSTSGHSNQLATGEGDLRSCRLPVTRSTHKKRRRPQVLSTSGLPIRHKRRG